MVVYRSLGILVLSFSLQLSASYLGDQGNDVVCDLLYAAELGQVNVIRDLVEGCGVVVNACDSTGWTALHYAAWNGHIRLIEELVVILGAQVNVHDALGVTPLHCAAWNGQEKAVEALFNLGSDIAACNRAGELALHYAAFGGHTEVVRLLARLSGDVSHYTNDGYTPLLAAIAWNHLKTMRVLVKDLGAGMDTLGDDGQEVVQKTLECCSDSWFEIVRFLTERGLTLTDGISQILESKASVSVLRDLKNIEQRCLNALYTGLVEHNVPDAVIYSCILPYEVPKEVILRYKTDRAKRAKGRAYNVL